MTVANKLENILDACLAESHAGRSKVEKCLQRYPDHAPALEPLLRQAARLAVLPPVTMPTDAVNALERRVLSRAAEIKAATSRKERPLRWPFWSRSARGRVRRLALALSLVIALALAGTWTVSAFASSLPGEALYPLKLVAEKTRLRATFRHEARARLHLAFAERRLGEMQTLLAQNRSVEEGLVNDLVTEAGLAVQEIEDVHASRRVEIGAKLLALIERQQAVLTLVQQRAPEEAQAGLSRALEASRRGHERAMMALGVMAEPSPTRKPNLDHTPHAKPTHTPKPTHTSRAKPTHKPTHTPKPDHTLHAKPTHKPTRTPEPTHTSHAKPTHKPTHTPKPDLTSHAKPTLTPEPDRTPHAKPTHKPTHTPKHTSPGEENEEMTHW
jgi:hypothetical protein